ncbi:MAG TPA: hypothetical protein PKL53_09220 [Methylotenera sp.]|nr:hypothetical protein [Methylotenera sp.]
MASAVALLPLLAMMALEIAYPDETDDSGFRGAAIAIGIMPFLYIIVVPVCYVIGTALASFGMHRLGRFMLGSAAIASLLGVLAGVLLSFPSRFGFNDVVLSSLIAVTLFLISALPAALCWWFLAVRPHNPSFKRDA